MFLSNILVMLHNAAAGYLWDVTEESLSLRGRWRAIGVTEGVYIDQHIANDYSLSHPEKAMLSP